MTQKSKEIGHHRDGGDPGDDRSYPPSFRPFRSLRPLRSLMSLASLMSLILMAQTPLLGEQNMKKLTKANLAKARNFIMTQARPLEQSLYRFRFEKGSKEAVLAALKEYQNPDGGFGKALEPDLRAPESSVLATLRGLYLLGTVETSCEHPMMALGLDYLAKTFDQAKAVWRIIPPTAGAHPHAPWWNQEPLDKVFGGFKVIPRAEILAFLYGCNSGAVSPTQRRHLARQVIETVESTPDAELAAGVEGCVRLFESGGLPRELRDRLYSRLLTLIPATVERDSAKWKQYCLKPLWLIRTPDSGFAGLLAESLQRNLDYEIENQSADGSWAPNWSWFGTYPETWPVAEKDWRGVLTVQTLETLQAFGRIEGTDD